MSPGVNETGKSDAEAEEQPESSEYFRSGRTHAGKPPVAMVVVTLLVIIGWAIFILFYALYWSTGFTTFQNVIVTIVSLFITGLVIGLMWVIAGPRDAWHT